MLNEILGLYLLRLGITSDTAVSGDLAVELLKNNSYWAVFCDLMLPGMNGLDLIRKMKGLDSAKPPRFVLLTGGILDDASEEAAASNHIVVCRKPFNFEIIKNTLHTLEQLA